MQNSAQNPPSHPGKRYIVRQDRINCRNQKIFIQTANEKYQVVDIAFYGLAIEATQDLMQSDLEVELLLDSRIIGSFHLIKVRSERKDDTYRISYAVNGLPIPMEALAVFEQVHQIVGCTEQDLQLETLIPEAFKYQVYQMYHWLSDLKEQILKLEKNSFDMPKTDLDAYEEAIAASVSPYLFLKSNEFYESMIATIRSADKELYRKCTEFFRKKVGAIFYGSPHAYRAYTKPRGYAGDFEMMNNMYYNEVRGADLFSKCLQRTFTDNPGARAVRNRSRYLLEKIQQACAGPRTEPTQILSVACGPAYEVRSFISASSQSVLNQTKFYLLDQDEVALQYAQREIEDLLRKEEKKAQIEYLHIPIKDLFAYLDSQKIQFDLIYSAGLFDYFTDPVAMYSASQLYQALKPKGSLVIGNFNVGNPIKHMIEFAADWNLIYRSEEDLLKLYHSIGKPFVEREEENINLFVNFQRK